MNKPMSINKLKKEKRNLNENKHWLERHHLFTQLLCMQQEKEYNNRAKEKLGEERK